MEYEIIKRHDLCLMEEIVNAKLQAGWKLQGGVSISKDSNTLCYCQAMIKHDEVKVNVKDNIGSDFEALAALFNKYN